MHIRPATPDDATRLGELGAMLVELHHGFDADRFLAPTAQTARGYGRFLVSQIDRDGVLVLVAEDAEGVWGYVYGAMEGDDWMALRGPAGVVYDLVVDPSRRRQGLGRRLLEEALSFLETRGAPRLVLSTAEQNVEAQRLFAAAGFRRTMIEMTRQPSLAGSRPVQARRRWDWPADLGNRAHRRGLHRLPTRDRRP
jgi:ribosomal protein S18 acetylase RimI-like enzyme